MQFPTSGPTVILETWEHDSSISFILKMSQSYFHELYLFSEEEHVSEYFLQLKRKKNE